MLGNFPSRLSKWVCHFLNLSSLFFPFTVPFFDVFPVGNVTGNFPTFPAVSFSCKLRFRYLISNFCLLMCYTLHVGSYSKNFWRSVWWKFCLLFSFWQFPGCYVTFYCIFLLWQDGVLQLILCLQLQNFHIYYWYQSSVLNCHFVKIRFPLICSRHRFSSFAQLPFT